MNRYVLDTDIFSLYRRGNPDLDAKIDAHSLDELAISVITVEEELSGWYRLLRTVRGPDELARVYERLAEAIPVLARWPILPMSYSAITRYDVLKGMNLNVRKMDLRIAAIVLEIGAILVTRNVRDFRRVPNLVIENWAA
jgi:tRNA(fMet)-specific endonuclease VapC